MTVISPADPIEMALATRAILEFDGPVYMRTGRSPAHAPVRRRPQIRNRQRPDPPRRHATSPSSPAASKWRARWKRPSCSRQKASRARVVNMATIKPIDAALLARCAERNRRLRHGRRSQHPWRPGRRGGRSRWRATRPCPIEFVGVKDVFGASGEPEELAEHFGLTAPHIADAARSACIARKKARSPMMSRFSLAGKNAVVTGGSRGIGRAIALGLAEAGADVALHLSRAAATKPKPSCAQIDKLGRRALGAADGCDRPRQRRSGGEGGARASARSRSWSTMPASTSRPISTRSTDADWDMILDTNLKGPFICAQVFLPLLAEAGGGSIVHIGSVSGQYGGPRTAHYAASKAGLISLAQVIARFGARYERALQRRGRRADRVRHGGRPAWRRPACRRRRRTSS